VRSISVQYPSRRILLSCARAEGSHLTLFVPSDAIVDRGEVVKLIVRIADDEEIWALVGRVQSQVGVRIGMVQEPGFSVVMEPGYKREAAEMIAQCAGRPKAQGTASNARYEADIRCAVRSDGRRIHGRISDVSAGGVFVATAKAPELRVGADVEVQFEPGLFGVGGQRIRARVVWRGYKRGRIGLGVRFTDRGARVSQVVRRYLPAPGRGN